MPSNAAKTIELRVALVRAVTRQKLDVLDGQEQLVAACVVEFETIVRRAKRGNRLQSREAADAVIAVHDEVADRERRRFRQNVGRLARATPLAHGNLGISVSQFPVQVTTVMAASLAWTLRLAGTATIISFLIGTLLGIFAAWRRGGFADVGILPFLSLLGAFPYFFLAMLAVYFLCLEWGWFPLLHASDLNIPVDWGNPAFLLSVVQHAILPALTIILTAMGGWMLAMRAATLQVMNEDYITVSRAKGLKPRRIFVRYLARNAIMPPVNAVAIAFASMLSGSIFVEWMFAYPGIGYFFGYAIGNRDFTLLQGILLVSTLTMVVANSLADALNAWIDPRVRS